MVDTSDGTLISERPRWVRQLAGALVMGVALALLAFAVLNLAQDASLWFLGRRIEAQVVGIWIEQDADATAEAPTFRWFIRYQFETPHGRVVTGVSRVSPWELSALGLTGPIDTVSAGENASRQAEGTIEDGGRVDVVYLPAYPAHNRLDDSRFMPVLACAYVPLMLLAGAGLVLGRSYLQNS